MYDGFEGSNQSGDKTLDPQKTMVNRHFHAPFRPEYSNFRRVPTSEDWFEVYEISSDHFVFFEPRHFEETIVNLLLGDRQAILIDTGCGIGNLRKAVEEVTGMPVFVVNTHTHLDHIGGNHQFNRILLYDHPLSHTIAANGVTQEMFRHEILADELIVKSWPVGFDRSKAGVPPFEVSAWLKDGEEINIGGIKLEVIFTPGEAVNHISLLDRMGRRLFCGDILLHGAVWTHLEGGSLQDLVRTYRKLMSYMDSFDYLMPGHNVPKLDKDLLIESLAGAEKVIAGTTSFKEVTDPWNRKLKEYSFGRFQIWTR